MQTLAEQVESTHFCVNYLYAYASIEGRQTPNFDAAYKSYYRLAAQLSDDVEEYVMRYEPGPKETLSSFRYRVWSVALRVGADKAVSEKNGGVERCRLIVDSLRSSPPSQE